MDKKVFLFGAVFLFLLIGIISATTDTIGSTGSSGGYGGSWVYGGQITASSSGLLQTIGLNFQTGGYGVFTVAIYADSGGSPSGLLCDYGGSASTATGWVDLDMSGCALTITSGTKYWLAFQASSSADSEYTDSGGSTRVLCHYGDGSCPFSYYTWQNPFVVEYSDTSGSPNMRMTYGTTTSTSTSTTTSTSTSSTSTSTSTSTSSTSTSSTSSTSTSTTSTSITTTINPFAPINESPSGSIPYDITYSLALPYFFAGMVVLVVGIAGFRTKRGDIAVLTGLVASVLFYLLIPNSLMLILILLFASLMAFALFEQLQKGKRG